MKKITITRVRCKVCGKMHKVYLNEEKTNGYIICNNTGDSIRVFKDGKIIW